MDDRGEHTGLIGGGFLFGLISLFLLMVCLKATGHRELAPGFGLAGSAILAALAGRFLWRKWRTAPTIADFEEDGDVQFSLAVFLLATTAPLLIGFAKFAPLMPLVLCAAAIPARMFVKNLRRV
jgi:vacuolar-type H+-ATPase subunit I/STV1